MITITNYESGEVTLTNEGNQIRLSRDLANRLIMAARMHTVAEFLEKLPSLLSEPGILQEVLATFEGKTSTERWNLKEKFARLQTLTKGYESKNPTETQEVVKLSN